MALWQRDRHIPCSPEEYGVEFESDSRAFRNGKSNFCVRFADRDKTGLDKRRPKQVVFGRERLLRRLHFRDPDDNTACKTHLLAPAVTFVGGGRGDIRFCIFHARSDSRAPPGYNPSLIFYILGYQISYPVYREFRTLCTERDFFTFSVFTVCFSERADQRTTVNNVICPHA